jgi:ABC-2 type transport system ATP-binding protein
VLISSHVLAEVAQTVQRALIIGDGRLVGDIALDQLDGGAPALEATYLELTGAL